MTFHTIADSASPIMNNIPRAEILRWIQAGRLVRSSDTETVFIHANGGMRWVTPGLGVPREEPAGGVRYS